MDEEKQVANNEVKETPPAEPTQQVETEKAPTDVSGTVDKETQPESSDRLDKHPRFQEVNRQKKEWQQKYETMLAEQEAAKQPSQQPQDPYANLSPEER
jgi:molecular chaperone GrpE (heat shock protein)